MKYSLKIISLLIIVFNINTAQATMIICIAGGTGAGKTTLSEKLKEQMNGEVEIISQDSYNKDRSHLIKEEKEKTNFDHPNTVEFTLLKKHLLKLKKGETVEVPTYDFSNSTRTKIVTTAFPKKIIILEGILVLAMPETRDLADIKIFIDVESDVRLLRRINRDMAERDQTMLQIQKQYLTSVKPMHQAFVEPSKKFADIIIPGGAENSIAMDLLVMKLNKILELENTPHDK